MRTVVQLSPRNLQYGRLRDRETNIYMGPPVAFTLEPSGNLVLKLANFLNPLNLLLFLTQILNAYNT